MFVPHQGYEDMRLRMWARTHGHRVMITVPCLLDHTGNGHSLLGIHVTRAVPLMAYHPERIDWQGGRTYQSKASFVDMDYWVRARRFPDAPPPWR
jgi:hypothetical protein